MLKIIIDWIFLAVCIIAYIIVDQGYDAVIIWPCLLLFYYYFYTSIRKPIIIFNGIKTYFKIDSFFLLFYYGLFYLPYQSAVLGLTDIKKNAFVNLTFAEYTNVSILASTIGLIIFMIGYNTGMRIKNKSRDQNENRPMRKSFAKQNLFVLTIFVVVFLLLFMKTGYDVLFGRSYSTSDIGDSTSNGIYFLVSHFVTVALAFSLIYYVFFREINTTIIIIGALGVVWCLVLLLTGDRNTFFIIGITILAGYFSFIKQIGKVPILLFLFLGYTLYQIIESSRMSSSRGIDSIITSAMTSGSESKSIDESSFTITTVTSRAAFALVPERFDYFYGKFKLIGFAGIIPYSRSLFVDPKDKFKTSSDVLVYGILGPNATWGVGTNIISDVYMDFGLVGILILMYLFGWYGGYVTRKVQLNGRSYMNITIYLVVLALYAEAPRYTFDFPVRNIAWTLGFFYFMSLFQDHKTAGIRRNHFT